MASLRRKPSTTASTAHLRDIANRTHRLATKQGSADTETLAELSRKCAVEAVVEGFRLSEAKGGSSAGTPKAS